MDDHMDVITDGSTATSVEEIARSLADRGVRFVAAAFSDVGNRARSKFVPVELLASLLAGSERYTPRGTDGLGDMNPAEPECITRPDLSTLKILPFEPSVAFMVADLEQAGHPYDQCPRSILKRQLARLADVGYRLNLGVEIEMYVFKGDGSDPSAPLESITPSASLKPTPVYLVDATLEAMPFLGPLVGAMQETGFGVFSFDHEGGFGQYEFAFAHDDALATADKLLFFRLMAREYARRAGGFATFMPKPGDEVWGSGAHFNMSLERLGDGSNAFVEAGSNGDRPVWTRTALAFAAGVMEHARAISAIAAPCVNSYKRLVTNLVVGETSWAPVWISLGDNNRSCMLRLPENRPAIECRLVDSAANPYLAAAMMVAAGLDGIERELDPGPMAQEITYTWTLERANRPRHLPRNLLEAIDDFADDPLSADVFGERFVRSYVAMKTKEWSEFHDVVSTWEREKYLTAF
jgi:glutamine synthetase